SEREHRRGAPARRNAVQEGTAIARGPASNGRVPGTTACDARKDCALAGAAIGARRRQQQQEEDAAGEPERRSVSCGRSSAPAIYPRRCARLDSVASAALNACHVSVVAILSA